MSEPQPNPPNHPVDYLAFALMALGAAAEMTDFLPSKYAGGLMAVYALAKLYSKWAATQPQKDALVEGQQLGQELKSDIKIIGAQKAEKV